MKNIYESVGVLAGKTSEGDDVVGIMLPCTEQLPEEYNGEDYDEIILTIPAAKALLIDLQEAIEIAIDHKG